MQVGDTANYVDSIDTLHFVGIVGNTGTADAEFVEILVNLRNAAGELVASESSFTSRDVVPAGESSPFHVIFLSDPGEWDDFEVVVQADTAGIMNPYTEFEVITANGSVPQFGRYQIVGEVRNTGENDAEFVEVIAVLYSPDDEILGVATTFTKLDKVPAGGTSPFTVHMLSGAQGEIARFELYVEGTRTN